MLSRQTALAIASAYTNRFSSTSRVSRGHPTEELYREELYDFLFEQEYEAWFCNLAKKHFRIRPLLEWIMKIHTGESLYEATKDRTWEQRRMLGQRFLRDLARDHLRWFEAERGESFFERDYAEDATILLRRLELDGYVFKDSELLQQQDDVLDVEKERGILQSLFTAAKLERAGDAFEFLRLAEEHFVASRWPDSISNARKFFELTLSEGAKALSKKRLLDVPESTLSRPVEIRQYLEREGLFERKERESVDKFYALLSETGAHPYMAESYQARLLRQLSLSLSQFVLLRLVSALSE